MLKWLRKQQNMRWVIIAGLAVMFVLWGVAGTLSRQAGPACAGSMFGRKVSWPDFDRAWQTTVRDTRARTRGVLPHEAMVEATWDRLMLVHEATRRGLRVSDAELAEALRRDPAFQDHGVFRPDYYRRILKMQGQEAAGFERDYRDRLLIAKLRQTIAEEVVLTDEEVRQAIEERFGRLRATTVLWPYDHYATAVADVDDAAVREYYHTHASAFAVPAQVRVGYVSLNDAPALTVEDAQTTPGEGASGESADASALAASERLAELAKQRRLRELQDEVDDLLLHEPGTTLEALADRLGVAVHDTGLVTLEVALLKVGATDEVRQALEALEPNMTSPLYLTPVGSVVLRVAERRPAGVPDLAAVRDRVVEAVRDERARRRAAEAAEAGRTLLAEWLATHPDTPVRQAASSLPAGAAIATPEPFARDEAIGALGVQPVLAAVAFDTPLRTVSTVVPIDQGAVVLVPAERLSPDAALPAEQQERFRRQLRAEHVQQHLAQWLTDLRQSAELVSFVEER